MIDTKTHEGIKGLMELKGVALTVKLLQLIMFENLSCKKRMQNLTEKN